MEKMAVPTGDVIKDWDIREGGKFIFYCAREKRRAVL
jgi:hypothetical protein